MLASASSSAIASIARRSAFTRSHNFALRNVQQFV
jgi:hypothetical protein